MTISVVIPAYNSAAFIREALESVFAQTRRPEEIVIVDDASTDDTRATVGGLAAEAPLPVRLIELARNTGGPATPLNVGIEASRGGFISLLDHDDVMVPEKLASQLSVLEEHPGVDLVFSDGAGFWRDGADREGAARRIGGEAFSLLITGAGDVHVVDPETCGLAFLRAPILPMSCSNMFFRKTLWTRTGGFKPEAEPAADIDFALRALDKPIGWVDRTLFRKRLHPGNLYHTNVFVDRNVLRWQTDFVRRFAGNVLLRQAVVKNTLTLVSQLRQPRYYVASVGVALGLIPLGRADLAASECVKTLAHIPFGCVRAAWRTANRFLRNCAHGYTPRGLQ